MSKPADNLYLLSYFDVMDRLDILLLEVRHVQMLIIYNLRATKLYLPLRFEEGYLFAKCWNPDEGGSLLINSHSSYDDAAIVRQWVIRYPTSKEAVNAYSNNINDNDKNEYDKDDCIDKEIESSKEKKRIEDLIKKEVGMIWIGDNWVRDQRLQYHILFALQILKQQIFKDKLTLTRGALQANLRMHEKKKSQLSKSAFMILRQGVTNRMVGYVDSLKNHKQHISKSNDFDKQRRSTGTIESRRELGIYMDFLSNRTRDIQRDILHLFRDFKLDNLNTQLVFHGWSEQTKVSNHYLNDDVNKLYLEYNKEGNYDKNETPIHDVGYINTSYWAPDRPDLQPIIAGKVAKTIIDNYLDGLDDVALSNGTDQFTGLIVDLKSVLSEHIDEFKQHGLTAQHAFICDIAGDLIAASTKGAGYLYAMFLLRIGDGLHQQLVVANEIKLDMAYMLEQGVSDFSQSFYWYARMKLCTSWLRKINKKSLNSLDKLVIDGVDEVADQLIEFLRSHSPEYRKSSLLDIYSITKDLQAVLDKHTKMIRTTKNWRHQRDNDDWDYDKCKNGKRTFSRTTRKLDLRLQNYLFRELLKRKTKINKPLHHCYEKNMHLKDLMVAFTKEYKLVLKSINIPKEKEKSCYHPDGLFEYMFDIPYQSSIIRSIDLLKKQYTAVPYEHFFTDIHEDIELGRVLFFLALEFHTREKESPEHRLSLCINQITFAYDRIKNIDLQKELKSWLFGSKKPFDMERDKFKLYLEKDIIKKVDLFKNNIKSIGALSINSTFSSINIVDVEKTRKMEFLAGCKIYDLAEIISQYKKNTQASKDYELLSPLLEFISIRRSSNDSFQTLHLRYYNKMLASMGDICEAKKNKYEENNIDDEPTGGVYLRAQDCLPSFVSSVMLQRLLVTNPYPVPNPQNIEFGTPVVRTTEKNSFLFYFSQYSWPKDNFHWMSLGRYDSVIISPVNQPCKCLLPSFQSATNSASGEQYYSFTSRKEVALLVWLTKGNREALGLNKEKKVEPCGNRLFAMLGVSLQRRGMRLDFIYRLIRALDRNTETEKSGLEVNATKLEESKIDFHVFLTDGWGDLLFVFIRNGEVLTVDQLNRLIAFQQAVNEDFMVDRTEMMFSPQCVDVALMNEEHYSVRIELTLMEDRWLEQGISLHHEQVKQLNESDDIPKFISSLTAKYLPSKNAVKLNIIAHDKEKLEGLKDAGSQVKENWYYQILEWLGKSETDGNPPMRERLERIETSIVQKIS